MSDFLNQEKTQTLLIEGHTTSDVEIADMFMGFLQRPHGSETDPALQAFFEATGYSVEDATYLASPSEDRVKKMVAGIALSTCSLPTQVNILEIVARKISDTPDEVGRSQNGRKIISRELRRVERKTAASHIGADMKVYDQYYQLGVEFRRRVPRSSISETQRFTDIFRVITEGWDLDMITLSTAIQMRQRGQ